MSSTTTPNQPTIPEPSDGSAPDASRSRSQSAVLFACALAIVTLATYARLYHANFVGWDDDIHVYQNPYLNPPTIKSVSIFWRQPYEGLYVPIAYTAYALIAHCARIPGIFLPAVGVVVHLDSAYFHTVNVGLHTINVLLVYLLLRRLVRNDLASFGGALLFSIHPLQVESVAWIAELRGQLSSVFCLLALLSYIRSRDLAASKSQRAFYALALVLTAIALLAKPSAVTVPLAALAIDLILLGGDWRSALARTVPWILLVCPFILITHNVQPVTGDAMTAIWQRPFIAGDALAFYVGKVFVPIKLAINYGRKPHLVLAHWWGYVMILAVGLLKLLSWIARKTRPAIWLGWLLFCLFLLPELGLVPFVYQHFSTVADRYAYLSMLGAALIVADCLSRLNVRAAVAAMSVIGAVLLALTWIQTGYWHDTARLMDHNLAVNPRSDSAFNNRGMMELGNRLYPAAIADFDNAIACLPTDDQAMVNLGKAYVETGRLPEARSELEKALQINPDNGKALSDLGAVLAEMGDVDKGVQASGRACMLEPTDPILRYNYAHFLLEAGRPRDALANYKMAIDMAPSFPQAHVGLGISLAETGDVNGAIAEFQTALSLDPSNPEAAQNLATAQGLVSHSLHS
jgi:Flp pilus assembly protein TadD